MSMNGMVEPSVCEALVRIQSNGTEIIMSQDNTIGCNLGLTEFLSACNASFCFPACARKN